MKNRKSHALPNPIAKPKEGNHNGPNGTSVSPEQSLARPRYFVTLCSCETPLFRYALLLRDPVISLRFALASTPLSRYALRLREPRFFVMLCPCGRPRSFVMLCSCVSEVPFGRKMRGVDVFSVGVVKVCGFRIGVGAKRNGGWGARSFLRARFWGEQNFYGCNDSGESEL